MSVLAGTPAGAPAGDPEGVPLGATAGTSGFDGVKCTVFRRGTPVGILAGTPAGAPVGAPEGVPVGAPVGTSGRLMFKVPLFSNPESACACIIFLCLLILCLHCYRSQGYYRLHDLSPILLFPTLPGIVSNAPVLPTYNFQPLLQFIFILLWVRADVFGRHPGLCRNHPRDQARLYAGSCG